MNKRHYEHTLPNIRGSLSNTYNFTRNKENRQIRANNVTDTTFIGLGVITAPTNIATAQRAMMTEKTN